MKKTREAWAQRILNVLKSDNDEWKGVTWLEDDAEERRNEILEIVHSLLADERKRWEKPIQKKIKKIQKASGYQDYGWGKLEEDLADVLSAFEEEYGKKTS